MSAYASKLDWSRILSFGKRLALMHLQKIFSVRGETHDFDTKYREYAHSVAVYQKYLTGLGELIIFEPWRENDFSQPS